MALRNTHEVCPSTVAPFSQNAIRVLLEVLEESFSFEICRLSLGSRPRKNFHWLSKILVLDLDNQTYS